MGKFFKTAATAKLMREYAKRSGITMKTIPRKLNDWGLFEEGSKAKYP